MTRHTRLMAAAGLLGLALGLVLPALLAPAARVPGTLPGTRTTITTSWFTNDTLAIVNVSAGDPDVDAFDQAAQRALATLLATTTGGSGTDFDHAPDLPAQLPASLVDTREVARAHLVMQGTVPQAAAVRAWAWSRWNGTGGYFTDAYSAGHDLVPSEGLYIQSTRYSPLAATGAALDTIVATGGTIPQAVADAVATFAGSCFSTGTGGYAGRPDGVPTLIDTRWAVVALQACGRLGTAPGTAIAGFVNGLRDPASGLHANAYQYVVLPDDHLTYPAATLSWLAVDTLSRLGMLGTLDAPAMRVALEALRDPLEGWFAEGHYYPHRVATGTAAAIAILERIGYPTGTREATLAAAVDAFDRGALFTGGWARNLGDQAVEAGDVAAVIQAMAPATGAFLAAIGKASLEGVLAACASSTPAVGFAGWCPVPLNQPAFSDVHAVATLLRDAGLQGMLDAPSLRSYVDAVSAGGVYPVEHPGTQRTGFRGTQAWRSSTGQGIVPAWRRLDVKGLLGMATTTVERAELVAAINASVVRGTDPDLPTLAGAAGLVLYSPDLAIALPLMKWHVPFAASLEATLAAVRVLARLGVAIDTVLDVPLLHQRLLAAFRESASAAWFTRESPCSFQAVTGGEVSPRLLATRLALAIWNETGGAAWPEATRTKLARTALDVPWTGARDVDNALAIMDLAGLPANESVLRQALRAVATMAIPGTPWSGETGLPSLHATLAAWRVLARVTAGRLALSGVVGLQAGGTGIPAGAPFQLKGMLVNAFSGPLPSYTYSYHVACGAGTIAAGTGGITVLDVPVPLVEACLGPAGVAITVPAAVLGRNVSLPATIVGALVLGNLSGTVPATARGTGASPVEVSLGLRHPLAPTVAGLVVNGSIVATCVETGAVVHFASRGATSPGTYVTSVQPSTLRTITTYHVEASRAHCLPASGTLRVEAIDGVETAGTIAIPVVLVTALPLVAGIAGRARCTSKAPAPLQGKQAP